MPVLSALKSLTALIVYTGTSKLEYSVLAIFVHKALIERLNHSNQTLKPALYAFIISFSIGVIDECIQIILPNRVFDVIDILFNGIAVSMAIGAGIVLNWLRKLRKKP